MIHSNEVKHSKALPCLLDAGGQPNHGLVEELNQTGTGSMKFTIPNFTLGQASKSDMRRDGGPLTRNIQVPDARVGIDLSGGGNAATMLIIERST